MPSPTWLHRYAVLVVAATLFLIFVGGLVTSTGSGLAVPDWPLSYGKLWPRMVGGVFYEHGHRTVASAVGLLTLILALLLQRFERRRPVRLLGWAAFGAVCLQGLLGGLTVIFLLPPAISISHATLAQTFLCVLVTLAVATSRSWIEGERSVEPDAGRLRAMVVVTTLAVYVQLVVGATMRHLGAGLAIPTFPFAEPLGAGGMPRLLPPVERLLADAGLLVHAAHRLGALVVAIFAVLTLRELFRVVPRASSGRPIRRAGVALAAALALQLSLGALTIWSGKGVTFTTLHVCNGAFVLATSMTLTLLVHRRYAPAPRAVSVPA